MKQFFKHKMRQTIEKTSLKRVISIRLIHIIATVIIICGGLLFWHELESSVRVSQAKTLEEVSLTDLQPGYYVTGDVSKFLGVYVETLGENAFLGSSIGFLSVLSDSYLFYTIPIGSGQQYVTLLLTERQENQFENIIDVEQAGLSVPITGKIIKLPTSINYKWQKEALGLKTDEEVNKVISPTYGIKLVDFEKEQKEWQKGLSILFTEILLLTLFGNLDEVITFVKQTPQPAIPYSDRPEHIAPDMLPVILNGKRKEKENLKKQYRQYIHAFLLYFFLSVILIYYSIKIYYLLVWFAAAIVVFLCFRNLWHCIIDGKSFIGKNIARVFDIRTINKKIADIDREIYALEHIGEE